MTDESLWRMFCETGDPFCFLMYMSARKEKDQKTDNPPVVDALAFSGTGESQSFRF